MTLYPPAAMAGGSLLLPLLKKDTMPKIRAPSREAPMNKGVMKPSLSPKLKTILKGHPSFRAPSKTNGSLYWNSRKALLFMPNFASIHFLPFLSLDVFHNCTPKKSSSRLISTLELASPGNSTLTLTKAELIYTVLPPLSAISLLKNIFYWCVL